MVKNQQGGEGGDSYGKRKRIRKMLIIKTLGIPSSDVPTKRIRN